MKPCDVFIGQSPMHVVSMKRVKKKWGAMTIIERGTSIVQEYIANLKDLPGSRLENYSKFATNQELKGYEYADFISVGADHVRQGFLKHGYPDSKIFVNNYGFDGAQFHPTEYVGPYDLIMVGNWSYRKGGELIIEACRSRGYRLLHVGGCSDLAFPQGDEQMTDIGIKPQYELERYYAQARVALMPSREEGLALVQMQSVACGLPLVCSKNSGGRDIRQYTQHPEYIIEMNELTVYELCRCIDEALVLAKSQTWVRNYVGNGLEKASFKGYGDRYNDFILKHCSKDATD